MSTYVITFESTNAAMAASKTLSSGGFDFLTIPTPVAISASCGIALKFDTQDATPFIKRVFGSKRNSGLATLYLQKSKQDFQLVERL